MKSLCLFFILNWNIDHTKVISYSVCDAYYCGDSVGEVIKIRKRLNGKKTYIVKIVYDKKYRGSLIYL